MSMVPPVLRGLARVDAPCAHPLWGREPSMSCPWGLAPSSLMLTGTSGEGELTGRSEKEQPCQGGWCPCSCPRPAQEHTRAGCNPQTAELPELQRPSSGSPGKVPSTPSSVSCAICTEPGQASPGAGPPPGTEGDHGGCHLGSRRYPSWLPGCRQTPHPGRGRGGGLTAPPTATMSPPGCTATTSGS